ncbi:MAG: SAM-dependent methyltransferase, partial [Chloroflexota bacterium]
MSEKVSHVQQEKEAVSEHYDTDPRVFQFFLDEKMNYSSAYFPEGTEDLDKAQEKKLDLIAEKIDLRPEDALLDVGCGWGNALLYYADHYGCRATGLTLAGNQAALIEEKAAEAGLAGQVSVVVEHFQEAAFPP